MAEKVEDCDDECNNVEKDRPFCRVVGAKPKAETSSLDDDILLFDDRYVIMMEIVNIRTAHRRSEQWVIAMPSRES